MEMITVETAKKLLDNLELNKSVQKITLTQAVDKVLAEDIFSPMDQPSFNNSSMDGYALASTSNANQKTFKLMGEIKAGDANKFKLQPGEAVRIFTGAIVPDTSDSIVIQEKVEEKKDQIILRESYKKGDFIRLVGSMLKKGEMALKKGSILNPAAIGYLASMGFKNVKAYKNPKVSIITTGNEIVKPGNKLLEGQIYESNSASLLASLKKIGVKPSGVYSVVDEKLSLQKTINQGLNTSDILIITGGISVGKYDLVYDSLNELGVETIFYKVSQKPGKPFYAGQLHHKIIFALPGNPAAVLVCFYQYIYPLIKKWQGFNPTNLPQQRMPILKNFKQNKDRAQFIRAYANENGVMPLEGQDSFMLHSFAMANALIYIPTGNDLIAENSLVEVHHLPFI